MTKLIALVALAAGAIAADAAAVDEGSTFDAAPDVAEGLLTEGKAKLAEPPLSENAKPSAAAKPAKATKARLLVDCALGNANDVVELDAATLKEAAASGVADSSKEAVAYALTLEQNKP